ncbi:ferredoxin reductase-like protein [Martensiomyces pterosporus]|nr:ferredoxin reductase-like protein [Martensiomyces pterosporus]
MEAIGATCAFVYYLHLYTDILKPEVNERLDPNSYTPFTLLEKDALTPDTTRFRFRVNRPRFDDGQEKLADSIISAGSWAVDVKDHMVQTYRTYTPVDYLVSDVVDEEKGSRSGYLDLVVKRYPHGSLSRFLHDTRVGDQVEMRGPIQTWPYRCGRYNRIYMVAGGTGIAPMYQVISQVLNDPEDTSTKISLLYGSRTEADIIYRKQLDDLAQAHGDRLKIEYIVDRGPTSVAKVGYPDKTTLSRFTTGFAKNRDVLLICGPDAMLRSVSGVRPIGPGQGPLRGILGELGFGPQDVFKF